MTNKTLEDLEFNRVLEQVAALCTTELGRKEALRIAPFTDKGALLRALTQTNEYLSSFENQNTIPAHQCDAITGELQLLGIEGTTLELTGLQRILRMAKTVQEHLVFFKKFKELYEMLFATIDRVDSPKEVIAAIEKVIDKYGEVKNEASEELARIRKEIGTVRGKINDSFNRALAEYNAADYLDDIRESVVEHRRVLAVKALFRRMVGGRVLGSSKTG